MKMARASQADIDMAMELANALEALSSRWGATMPDKIAKGHRDEERDEAFCLDDPADCRRVCEYLIELARSASLFRVAMGMAVVLDPRNELLDPDADTLQAHPKIQAALSAIDPLPDTHYECAVREMDGLRADAERYRWLCLSPIYQAPSLWICGVGFAAQEISKVQGKVEKHALDAAIDAAIAGKGVA